MQKSTVIKWRFIWGSIWIIGILYVILYIGEDQLFDTHYTAWVFGFVLLILGTYYYFKTRVVYFLITGIVLGTGYWHYEAAEHMDTPFSMLTFYVHLVLVFSLLLGAGPFMNKAFRLEVHARKLFRLAAEGVLDSHNGYTERPYSAGKLDASFADIIGLARFLAAKDIIRYNHQGNGITYSFSMNISPLVDRTMNRSSTVHFSTDGNVSVKISQQDYNQYRDKLSFDQLCASFSTLFAHFTDAYKQNNENRIIQELKAV
jgi:hypothetical protein